MHITDTIKNPIIAITGSSGAGTSSVMTSFMHIFSRLKLVANIIEGDSMHKYNRVDMKQRIAEEEAKGNNHFSHFGPDANILDELANTFRTYKDTGTANRRYYIHNDEEGELHGSPSGTFTSWSEMPVSDLLFYEGLHGGFIDDKVNVAENVDLLIGVVPIINLEWIQKIHRDKNARGYSTEAVMDTILRRMPDYVNHICPQFSKTDINFQRIPTVDTSNPFIARDIPTPDESFVVIRFRDPKNADFPYLLDMLHGSFMSRRNDIVVPGGKMGLAMEIIFTPLIEKMTKKTN